MIDMLGVALTLPLVLGALMLGMEHLERRLDRPPSPVSPPRRIAPRPVATLPSRSRGELGLP